MCALEADALTASGVKWHGDVQAYLSIDEGAQNGVPDVVLLAHTLVKHCEGAVGGVNIAVMVLAGGLSSIGSSTSSEL